MSSRIVNQFDHPVTSNMTGFAVTGSERAANGNSRSMQIPVEAQTIGLGSNCRIDYLFQYPATTLFYRSYFSTAGYAFGAVLRRQRRSPWEIMADFKTHISTSTVLGIGYASAAYLVFNVPATHCFIAGGLCSVAGMLPDLDSNSGIPQREMLSFVAVIVPMLMLPRMECLGCNPEHMVFLAALTYVIIRFGIGSIFKRYTKHRGMWHSIPAAMIAGMATFLVCLSPELGIRLFKSWAVVIGFVSHLILDEIYAVDWQGRKIRVKKSFGTALKMFGSSSFVNWATYGKLVLLAVMIASDAKVMDYFGSQPLDIPWSARDWVLENIHTHDHDSLLR